MKKRIISVLGICALCGVMLSACGSGGSVSYTDGTYEGQSSVYQNDDGTDDGNGYGVVSLTIADGVVTECTFETYEEDGTLKGEDYGKEGGEVANRDYYNKAQKAVAACDEYASALVQAEGDIDAIDSISGATINYNNFVEAVEDALSQAEATE